MACDVVVRHSDPVAELAPGADSTVVAAGGGGALDTPLTMPAAPCGTAPAASRSGINHRCASFVTRHQRSGAAEPRRPDSRATWPSLSSPSDPAVHEADLAETLVLSGPADVTAHG